MGDARHTVIGPTPTNWPIDSSNMKSGIPQTISMMMYGIRNAPVTEEISLHMDDHQHESGLSTGIIDLDGSLGSRQYVRNVRHTDNKIPIIVKL